MPRLRRRKQMLVVLVILLAAMRLGRSGTVSAADDKKTLVIALTADPRNISLVSASTFHDWVVGYRVYSALFQADANFQPVPDLATSWEVSADQLTYTFHLKRNATFHDGSPITAEDVVFSVMEVALPHGSICGRWGRLLSPKRG